MVQSLVSNLRKVRDYEDANMPPWASTWMSAHPEDRAQAEALLAQEPAPAHKIPKGQELPGAKLP
jgi:hypothetical protein